MTRRALVLVLLAAVVLAGCMGGLGTETDPSTEATDSNGTATVSSETTRGVSDGSSPTEPTDGNETATVSSESIPGVSDGTLTNATALARANEASLTETGGAVRIRRQSSAEQSTFDLVVGAGLTTYQLTGSRSASDDAVDFDLWSNDTTRVIRTRADGEYNYRTNDRRDDRLSVLSGVEEYLAAGNFTVANESTGNGTVVLTADTFVTPADSYGPLTDVGSLDGRLVVSESGLIRSFTVAAATERETGSYSYTLLRTGVDRVDKPDWFDDVPAGATLQMQLDVNVENSSYLVVRNGGGDHVPSNTTISVTSNNTTTTATLDTSLMAGDTRYAYIDAATGTLQVTADRPTAGTVDSVTSPISVSLTTEDGASLYSAGMAWSSESAAASGNGSSGGSSSESSDASGGSASGGESGSTSNP
ncbi:hypothetical protein [Halorientalis marina]|uniref:hypothetical protein n=1 Tax=Halorientalis marina TaxID=2931976 RepID=UPI001FF18AEB|nr:hypothetical protein [Halorientalis marina]